jgi:hypothetical protein
MSMQDTYLKYKVLDFTESVEHKLAFKISLTSIEAGSLRVNAALLQRVDVLPLRNKDSGTVVGASYPDSHADGYSLEIPFDFIPWLIDELQFILKSHSGISNRKAQGQSS